MTHVFKLSDEDIDVLDRLAVITHPLDKWSLDMSLKNGLKYLVREPATRKVEDHGSPGSNR